MKRCVIKLSSQLTVRRVWPYVRIITEAMRQGDQLLVVAGGAVKRGSRMLGFGELTTLQKQAAAGIGQPKMMESWTKSGREFGMHVAQLQYTHHDILNPENNIRQVIEQYFEWGVICIANANDVAIDEETRLTAKVSENSALARLLAETIEADTLILLGVQSGVYTVDPELDPSAQLIREVTDLSDSFLEQFSDEAAEGSFGGMKTNAANCLQAARAGIKVIVTKGVPPNNLRLILNGQEMGTVFRPAR